MEQEPAEGDEGKGKIAGEAEERDETGQPQPRATDATTGRAIFVELLHVETGSGRQDEGERRGEIRAEPQ